MAQLQAQIMQKLPCVNESSDNKNSNANPNQRDHSKALQLRIAAAEAINSNALSCW
jgi:hypothetical protein